MNRSVETGDDDIWYDMCTHVTFRLENEWGTDAGSYRRIFKDAANEASRQRKGAVPRQPTCVDSCVWDVRKEERTQRAEYRWRDAWAHLQMEDVVESWTWVERFDSVPHVDRLTITGLRTDGTALQDEVDKYVRHMNFRFMVFRQKLAGVLRAMQESLLEVKVACDARI